MIADRFSENVFNRVTRPLMLEVAFRIPLIIRLTFA